MAENLEQTRKSYDLMAEEYVSRLYDKLEHLPLDCELLERFARAVRDQGLVCDIGCGPGQVARYLHERGVAVVGLDLSPRMVELARQLNPGITFQQGDMAKLKAQDASWAGIVAFYSIIHIPRSEVIAVLSEWWRVLQPGGLALLSFHRGQKEQHVDTLWDQQISLDFTFFECAEMEGYLREAGYVVEERRERGPYPGFEVETQRCYVLARKPAMPAASGSGLLCVTRSVAGSRKSVCRRRRRGSSSAEDPPSVTRLPMVKPTVCLQQVATKMDSTVYV